MIYMAHAPEGLRRQLRKVTKNRTVFPHDEALTRILYPAIQNIVKR